jgi:polysaccharide biosynthesis transport protein
LLALGAGVSLGLVLAFFVEYLARSSRAARTSRGSARPLGVEVLPTASSPTRRPVITGIVSLRALDCDDAHGYSSLHDLASLMGLERVRCVAVTSPFDRDGKTEALTDLAILLARAGRRVVVVDCDLREPRVHGFFGFANKTGFTSVMQGAPLAATLRRVPSVDHLYALTSGPLPADPDEMLASNRCVEVLSSLRVGGTLILIDTSPLLTVTDALTLARTAPVDGIVLVASPRADESEHLRQAFDILQREAVQPVDIVLSTPDAAAEEQPVIQYPQWPRRRNSGYAIGDAEAWNGLM